MNEIEIINQMNFVNLGWQIGAPLLFILGDIIVGIITAIIRNDLSTPIMRQGLMRKSLLVIIILLSFVIHFAFNIEIISKIVCGYIILMELISILENLKEVGVELGKIGELLKIEKGEQNK